MTRGLQDDRCVCVRESMLTVQGDVAAGESSPPGSVGALHVVSEW